MASIGFTRQETIALTGLTSSMVSHYDEIGLVVPQKYGNPVRPSVFYSPEQIAILKLIQFLKGKLTMKQIRDAISPLNQQGLDCCLFRCELVFVDGKPHLVKDLVEFSQMIKQLSESRVVHIRQIAALGDILPEIEHAAVKAVPDYFNRVKRTVLDRGDRQYFLGE